ncbi:hypothetical protein FDENT_14236 [Fusarium denticulatum]|uniref:BTB domain-containing protein n=2 Tax=Fusarium TaxID=5506 RepID=A0A9P8INF2_9HYPO|nr:hypothetical protein J7337_008326 [Fusarium musae]KAF5656886.1 hypothetical protein FDENT_14236 [Fusarium denticulatum]KAG9499864.1 hypothetical protein J7337_008326 [Fusarium musae]
MAAQSAQSKALASLLKTGDYSDLTILCGKDQYRGHKAIIYPQPNFFKAAGWQIIPHRNEARPSWPPRARRAKRSSTFSKRATTPILRFHVAKISTATRGGKKTQDLDPK